MPRSFFFFFCKGFVCLFESFFFFKLFIYFYFDVFHLILFCLQSFLLESVCVCVFSV